tara:strand:- start:5689 stop:5796 length:108 start_codon:yes stop_codon:yes gene_type:complete
MQQEIEPNRLLLRPFVFSDAECVAKLAEKTIGSGN